MDADVRTLRYVQRFPGSAPLASLTKMGALGVVAAPPMSPSAQEAMAAQAKLEARIHELERECLELDRRGRHAVEQAHEAAAHAQSAALREQQERMEAAAAERVFALAAAFVTTQREYFQAVEVEVVRLALAVAARILHREAQIDPLLLRGAVRVALEDLQQQETCVLEVAAPAAENWRNWLAAGKPSAAKIELRVREEVAADHCRLEIESSTADLSTTAQLAEIERGFFDLLQQRPLGTAEVRA